MAGPFLVHVDGGGGKGPGHVAHTAGVVQMDVGHRHPGQVTRAHAEGVERVEQHPHRALAARLHQDRRRPVHQVAGRHLLPPPEEGVDLDDAGSDLRGRHVPTSITTFTSSGCRANASAQCSRGTRLVTSFEIHEWSAFMSASAAAW